MHEIVHLGAQLSQLKLLLPATAAQDALHEALIAAAPLLSSPQTSAVAARYGVRKFLRVQAVAAGLDLKECENDFHLIRVQLGTTD